MDFYIRDVSTITLVCQFSALVSEPTYFCNIRFFWTAWPANCRSYK